MLIDPITSAVNGERHGPLGNEGGAQETRCGGGGGRGVMAQLPQLWWVPREGDVWAARSSAVGTVLACEQPAASIESLVSNRPVLAQVKKFRPRQLA